TPRRRRRHSVLSGRASSLVKPRRFFKHRLSRSSRELVLIHESKRLVYAKRTNRQKPIRSFGAEDEI
ncbi:MAG: hypothetical protein J6U60_00365, partial [Clostridia bacterium]|nr:hypothetical protein [Clostridia bacterium]